jgi:hypothetical protein
MIGADAAISSAAPELLESDDQVHDMIGLVEISVQCVQFLMIFGSC